MNLLHFELVTPEKTILKQELQSLTCPTTMGKITILPGHTPLVANLIPGELIAKMDDKGIFLHVSGGFVEIRQNNEIVVLADAAEHAGEIDEQRAVEAKQRAEKMLKEKQLFGEEYARVAASLERSLSRLRIAKRHAHKKSTPITGEGVFKE